jgi:hypothetical protein
MQRDDLLILIHKALRHGLLQVTQEAGATDWDDPESVEALHRRWDTVAGLIRSHASHEDRYIFALLETKQPGVTQLLGIGHDRVEAELDALDDLFDAAFAAPDPSRGHDAYLALTRFAATALAHFADEEPAVMDRIWATCTDEEIAVCRVAFMAEITPEESLATAELMIPATSHQERAQVIGAARASAPPAMFQTILDVAARTLSPSQLAALHARLDEQAPSLATAR